MSKKQYIKRYILIINKLRKKTCSFEELQNYLRSQSEIDEEDYTISIRTFQRDVKEIASLFNIVISHNRSQNNYEITLDGNEERNERLMETFEIFNALNLTDSLSNQIVLEKRKPLGTENMQGLLHAIKNSYEVNFVHEKYWEEAKDKTYKTVQPLALKEARYRWYLIAKDLKDNRIKTFGLDRLTDLEITKTKFEFPKNYNPEAVFQYSFGVITDENPPQKIVLSFSYEQGKYAKSLPLHHSQKEIFSSENEYRVELFLHPTYDFVMELLSMGNQVKVLEPKSLKVEIREKLEAALGFYK